MVGEGTGREPTRKERRSGKFVLDRFDEVDILALRLFFAFRSWQQKKRPIVEISTIPSNTPNDPKISADANELQMPREVKGADFVEDTEEDDDSSEKRKFSSVRSIELRELSRTVWCFAGSCRTSGSVV